MLSLHLHLSTNPASERLGSPLSASSAPSNPFRALIPVPNATPSIPVAECRAATTLTTAVATLGKIGASANMLSRSVVYIPESAGLHRFQGTKESYVVLHIPFFQYPNNI